MLVLSLVEHSTLADEISPARVLQDELAARLSPETASRKWSGRASLFFILVICGASWTLVAWLALAVAGR